MAGGLRGEDALFPARLEQTWPELTIPLLHRGVFHSCTAALLGSCIHCDLLPDRRIGNWLPLDLSSLLVYYLATQNFPRPHLRGSFCQRQTLVLRSLALGLGALCPWCGLSCRHNCEFCAPSTSPPNPPPPTEAANTVCYFWPPPLDLSTCKTYSSIHNVYLEAQSRLAGFCA